MILEETQDKKDILILLMINERDQQIELLETENTSLKRLLIDIVRENNHLHKVVRDLKGDRYKRNK